MGTKIDREWLCAEILKVSLSLLSRSAKMNRVSPFRSPTKKELDRHPKLIEKQRRYLGGMS